MHDDVAAMIELGVLTGSNRIREAESKRSLPDDRRLSSERHWRYSFSRTQKVVQVCRLQSQKLTQAEKVGKAIVLFHPGNFVVGKQSRWPFTRMHAARLLRGRLKA